MQSFVVNRDLPEGRYRLSDIFSGLEDVKLLNEHFGDSSLLRKLLEATAVTLTAEADYMHVNDRDGSVVVGVEYLRAGDLQYLYLDIIHELVHVKQYWDGKELFDEKYSYVDRPTEIEAYRCTVEEARRIGMSDEAIADYLYVEWITANDHKRLLKTLGVPSKRLETS